jgi:uncharacterized protein YkwD
MQPPQAPGLPGPYTQDPVTPFTPDTPVAPVTPVTPVTPGPVPLTPTTTQVTNNSVLSESEKQTLLNKHNEWRNKYNSPSLVWDDNLTSVAQDWANKMASTGNFSHRQPNKYGENLWMGTAGAFPIGSAVDSWGDEVNDYNISNNTCAPGKVCGHFTQLVWSDTSRLGCGKATGKDGNDYIACNYDPPGNFVGQSPFTKR